MTLPYILLFHPSTFGIFDLESFFNYQALIVCCCFFFIMKVYENFEILWDTKTSITITIHLFIPWTCQKYKNYLNRNLDLLFLDRLNFATFCTTNLFFQISEPHSLPITRLFVEKLHLEKKVLSYHLLFFNKVKRSAAKAYLTHFLKITWCMMLK